MNLRKYKKKTDIDIFDNIENLFKEKINVKIHFFYKKESMEEFFSIKLEDWVSAVAFDKGIAILINKEDDIYSFDIATLLAHEYTHLLIDKTFLSKCPLWLNEGLAVVICKQYDNNIFKNMDNIKDVNWYEIDYNYDNFYQLSAMMVKKICIYYGIDKIIDAAKKCENFEKSLMFCNDNLRKINNEVYIDDSVVDIKK